MAAFAPALPSTYTFSPEATWLRQGIAEAREPGPSIALTTRERSLYETFRDVRESNWDGYGAEAVSAAAYHNALVFLQVLPGDVPDPEFSPEPDGEIAFEWHMGPRRVFSVSVGPTARLAYAGLFGRTKLHGIEEFTGVLPEAIALGLRKALSTIP